MKKITAVTILFSLLLSLNTAIAQTSSSDYVHTKATIQEQIRTTKEVVGGSLEKYRNTAQEQHVERLQYLREYAQKMIDRRNEVLSSLRERIEKYKNLTDAEKQALLDTVKGSEDGLRNLVGKIDSEEDLDQLKNRVREIADEKIFQYVTPKIHLVAMAEKIKAVLSRMRAITGKIEQSITRAQEANLDISSIEAKYEEYKGQLVVAQNTLNEAEDLIQNLTEDLEDPKAIFVQAKAKVKNAHEALKSAHRLVKEIASSLKELDKNSSQE
ncbi:MAG: hypothetical protein COT91_02510 [Candidatus Doudnabacteria bacterium CG10_big_fil_rev_8_21_14_0_10_41_10]|uniref:DUF5667 domain-containing protein n=1 Tax=Candidatus Doudnabacteria bacterium CG10_big_fil_rev_8_21_14_0_10_41_10 TaxID=1974551 RepID=A0A2H0VDP0_9BACT|nr:MAG: hypothetical protein COT91_02510 [Candidatus Doudnabacteria bacterium CG10_big_fil_rev_8_21_14_0_10_41_10]